MMFNKFSVSAKLYLLLLITAAGLVGLGLFGIDDIKRMDDNTHSLYADRVLPMRELSEIRFSYAAEILPMAQRVKNHLLTFSEASLELRHAQEIINTNWQAYKLTYLTPQEAQMVRETDLAKERADEACSELQSILANEDPAALDRFSQQQFAVNPDPFFVKLTQLMALQVQVSKEILNNNNEIYRHSTTRFLLLIAGALILSLSLSFYIVKNIRDLIGSMLNSSKLIKESEERYRSLFEQASDAIYVNNAKGDFTQVNDSMCKITGYSRDELLTMNVRDLLNAHLLKLNPLQYSEAEPGTMVTGERKFIHRNGAVVDIEINGKKFTDDRTLVISRVITERKKAEDELRSSEQKYKLLFESNPVPLSMIAKDDLSIIAINQTAADLYGYTKDELLNRSAGIVRLAEDFEQQKRHFQSEVEGPTDRGIVRHVKKDGTILFVNVIVNDILFEGRMVRLVLSSDVTEKLKAEALLKTTEANLQTILSTTDTAYALINSNLEILEYNNKALVFAKNEFQFDFKNKGKLFDLMPESRRAAFLAHIQNVFKGHTISYEVSYPRPENNESWYSVRMFPISDKDNEILGLVLAIDDITERKQAEQSLQTAYERIKANVQFIREIIWKQSHILRSPLANLKGLMAILRADPGDKEVLGYIENEFERMDSVLMEMAEDSSKDEMS